MNRPVKEIAPVLKFLEGRGFKWFSEVSSQMMLHSFEMYEMLNLAKKRLQRFGKELIIVR
jgi:hypothetical protein